MPYTAKSSSPRIVTRRALRVTCVATPLALLLLVAWITWGYANLEHRRTGVLMLYLLLLAIAMGSGIVAVVGTCFTAVHKAFSAGYQTGLQVGHASEAGRPNGPSNGDGNRDHLRLVDHDA